MARGRTRTIQALVGICVLGLMLTRAGQAQYLRISDNHRFLVTEEGKPFFYLADTAWELFHRADRDEADFYLRNRAGKGFTAVQAVVLSEINGLTVKNREGQLPLIDLDPTKPNENYFALVDFVVDRAASYRIYTVLLPTWGSWVEDKPHPLFENHAIFNPQNAFLYGRWLGKRYSGKWNGIWMLGGDRDPQPHMDLWDALARGLKDGDQGKHLMTYHPYGGTSSSQWLESRPWLDFNVIQVGHDRTSNFDADAVTHDYHLNHPKPVLDGETTYEDHPVNFTAANPRFSAYDVRKAAYWAVFAGAFGHTYGNANVWQMYRHEYVPIVAAHEEWMPSLESEGAFEMIHLRHLMESRPFRSRIPDQNLLIVDGISSELGSSGLGPGPAGRDSDRIQVTRDGSTGKNDATYLMAYLPIVRDVRLNTSVIAGNKLCAWWYDPRHGLAYPLGIFNNKGKFSPGWKDRIRETQPGPDWVLVVDDAA